MCASWKGRIGMEQFMTEKGEINYNSIWILKWSTREEGLGQRVREAERCSQA